VDLSYCSYNWSSVTRTVAHMCDTAMRYLWQSTFDSKFLMDNVGHYNDDGCKHLELVQDMHRLHVEWSCYRGCPWPCVLHVTLFRHCVSQNADCSVSNVAVRRRVTTKQASKAKRLPFPQQDRHKHKPNKVTHGTTRFTLYGESRFSNESVVSTALLAWHT
jgi:hypothetical protein